jgi:NhaP-type Na+/H+ or K+/H+ antiporter
MVELASILVLSVIAQWLAWKIKVPAILPLIIIGLAVGPLSTFLTSDGQKLLDGDAIFSGDFLFSFVSISVGIILFEGGLTLTLSEVRYRAGTIRNLLIFGPIITLVGGGLAAHYLMGLDYGLAFLFGGLIIVSGPTVVLPILRNTRPNERINTILKWEGILIDPLGALVAVLVYEFIQTGGHHHGFNFEILQEFFLTVATGVFVGAITAFFLRWVLQKNRIPEYLRNIFTLGVVIFAFTFSEIIQPEAGLMAATFMGIILANIKINDFKKIISFKEDITLILISVLFILLSSRIDMAQINKLGWESIALFAIVIFVLRPLAVWLSTIGKGFNWREVIFMSWVGPKGIVAAAVASLFSIQLMNSDGPLAQQAELILPLTFLVIVGTVVLQGSTAKGLAKLLKVTRKEPKGFLIAGANEVARFIAKIVKDQGLPVMMVDVSASNAREAKEQGFDVFEGNILSEKIFDEVDLANMGRLLALTPNNEINNLADKWFEEDFGDHNTYRLASKNELELKDLRLNKTVLFQGKVDYLSLAQIMRQHESSIVTDCPNDETFEKIKRQYSNRIIPLFILDSTKDLQVFTRDEPAFSKGDKLIFITYDAEQKKEDL